MQEQQTAPLRCFAVSLSSLQELLAGGLAGGLAKTAVAPLERTKIILQVAFEEIYKLEDLQPSIIVMQDVKGQ
jgi:hypothetical protein